MPGVLSRPVSKASWLALAPLIIALVMRKHGGFYYRSFISTLCIGIMASFGVVSSLVLPLIGKRGWINWLVARGYYHLCGKLLDITTTVEGQQYLDPSYGPAVYVCNHQSSLDVLMMGSVFPKMTSVVAKKALKYYPFLGWFMILSNAVFLDRKNRESAVSEAKQAASDIHKKKTSVWLFPEGTRGRPLEIDMLPFKKGAFYMAVQARVPIIPIVVSNYQNIYNSKAKHFTTGNVKIRVLPPIPTDGVEESSEDINRLTNHVRDQMLTALRQISPDPISF
ncbi:acyltransferase-domain-containing protein [Hesseltinella vesiculosa]|uniref:1-acyl-sn-glycerol-3-phosphate acyltransferase n=1 Tax=Hesseltinella vesiculosa TaxID=101127 RepID=A0A1X2GDX9_9FUNG|nr:acyltransferase-domain-containing protein [Hesseltinella vesiculosa]